jgi:hypothetical protein
VGKTTIAASFFLVFAALVGILAAAGQSFIAIWHSGPVSGSAYWVDICLSPEIFIFVFFMMSDPRTSPRSQAGQVAYGVGTAALAALLLAPQPTEYGLKVAILASLTAVCAIAALVRLVVERRALGEPALPSKTRLRTALWGAHGAAVLATIIIAIAAMADTLALSSDRQIVYLEQGLTGTRNPQ